MKDCTNPSQFSGDYGERDPPVPMPNTEVKPFSADGTWLETTWESRTLPDSMKKDSPLMGWVLFSFHLQRLYVLVKFDEVRECTWLGSIPCADCGGSSAGLNTWESRRQSAEVTLCI